LRNGPKDPPNTSVASIAYLPGRRDVKKTFFVTEWQLAFHHPPARRKPQPLEPIMALFRLRGCPISIKGKATEKKKGEAFKTGLSPSGA